MDLTIPARNVPFFGGPKHRYFLRIFHSAVSDFLIIPSKFVKDHLQEVPPVVTLITSDYIPWTVTMEKLNDIVFLDKGWNGFAQAYHITHHNILLFAYDQDKEILVTIFDYPGIVKQIPLCPQLNVNSLLAAVSPDCNTNSPAKRTPVASLEAEQGQLLSHGVFQPYAASACRQSDNNISNCNSNIQQAGNMITIYRRRNNNKSDQDSSLLSHLAKDAGPLLQLGIHTIEKEPILSLGTGGSVKRKLLQDTVEEQPKLGLTIREPAQEVQCGSASSHTQIPNGRKQPATKKLRNDLTKDKTLPISGFFMGDTIVEPSIQIKRKKWPSYTSTNKLSAPAVDHCYILMMAESVTKPFLMELPTEFVAPYINYGQTDVILTVKTSMGSKSFCVICYRSTTMGTLTSGWEEFVQEMKIKSYDCCRFQHKHASCATWFVEIVRGFSNYTQTESAEN